MIYIKGNVKRDSTSNNNTKSNRTCNSNSKRTSTIQTTCNATIHMHITIECERNTESTVKGNTKSACSINRKSNGDVTSAIKSIITITSNTDFGSTNYIPTIITI